jgi:hemolysin III
MSTGMLVTGATPGSGHHPATAARDHDDELLNSLTHGLGLVLSVAGLSALVALAARIGTTRSAVGCGVYGASLVLLYAASTLCHGWPAGKLKRVFVLLDHIGIYVLIAGTYTPVALFAVQGLSCWSCLTVAWGFALFGSCAKVARIDQLEDDSAVPYLVMCALCLLPFRQLLAIVPHGETAWILAGDAFYVTGLIFFYNDQKRFYHSIWHLFVLAGSICHYRAVLSYVVAAIV